MRAFCYYCSMRLIYIGLLLILLLAVLHFVPIQAKPIPGACDIDIAPTIHNKRLILGESIPKQQDCYPKIYKLYVL